MGDRNGRFKDAGDLANANYSYFALLLPRAVATGDVNNDGVIDVVSLGGNYRDNLISVRLREGDGVLGIQNDYALGSGYPSDMTLDDVDGDGNLDLLTVKRSYYGYVNVYSGDGTGAFDFDNPQNYFLGYYSYPDRIKVEDYNGDGVSDLVAGNSRQLSLLPGLGNGEFGDRVIYNNPLRYSRQSEFADLNNDGIIDLLTLPYYYRFGGFNSNSVVGYLGNADGSFGEAVEYPLSHYPYKLLTEDINSDEILDVVTINSRNDSLSVLIGQGDGSFSTSTEYSVGDNPQQVVVGDVNDDGIADLVSANVNSISLLLGTGDGNFAEALEYNADGNPVELNLEDLDDDGDLDLVHLNRDGQVKVNFNNLY
ncbi:MAG: VCBS repeat-containing protein, partial [Cyanobacteria bacterium P01_A01_bin.40]